MKALDVKNTPVFTHGSIAATPGLVATAERIARECYGVKIVPGAGPTAQGASRKPRNRGRSRDAAVRNEEGASPFQENARAAR